MKCRAQARLIVFLSLVLFLSGACSKKPAGKRYELQGRVVAVDLAAHQVTIAHQDIPGLMPGMTMPFLVAPESRWALDKIAPGDSVHATLVLSDHAEIEDISFAKGMDSSGDGTSTLRLPQPGDQVPDFALVNQAGKVISLHQFQGKPLLLTFIYTRCPFPDFCPRMSNNFGKVLQELQSNPKAFAQAQLLSITIDPDYDKAAVLHSYGEGYVGRLDPQFEHWQFATGSPEQIRKITDYFGLAHTQKDGQIVHGLRTILIAPDGKVAKVYNGSDWSPAEVAAAIETETGS